MEEHKKILTRIQIRRITTNPEEPIQKLNPGELAFSEKTNTLFIGTITEALSSSDI